METNKARAAGVQLAEMVWLESGGLDLLSARSALELRVLRATCGLSSAERRVAVQSADARWQEICGSFGVEDPAFAA